jgi:hypothetical protein
MQASSLLFFVVHIWTVVHVSFARPTGDSLHQYDNLNSNESHLSTIQTSGNVVDPAKTYFPASIKFHPQREAIERDLYKAKIVQEMSGKDIHAALEHIFGEYPNVGGRLTWQVRAYLEQLGVSDSEILEFMRCRKRHNARIQSATRRRKMQEGGFTGNNDTRVDWSRLQNANFAKFLDEKGFKLFGMTPEEFDRHWVKTDLHPYTPSEFGNRLAYLMTESKVSAEWRAEYKLFHDKTTRRLAWRKAIIQTKKIQR